MPKPNNSITNGQRKKTYLISLSRVQVLQQRFRYRAQPQIHLKKSTKNTRKVRSEFDRKIQLKLKSKTLLTRPLNLLKSSF